MKTCEHVTLTDFFGDGLCLYKATYDSPSEYTGDCEKFLAGPFANEEEGWAYANRFHPELEQMIL